MADTPPEQARTEVDEQTLARILRCEPMTIRRYLRLGVIKRESNKKFPLFQSIGQVVEYLRGLAGNQGSGANMKAGAALKDAQRRLTEMKLAKLDGALMSMPEIEALWGDLAAATKWLFIAFPAKARAELGLDDAQQERLSVLAMNMLREVAFSGQMQLPSPSADRTVDNDADSDDDDGDAAITDPERTLS